MDNSGQRAMKQVVVVVAVSIAVVQKMQNHAMWKKKKKILVNSERVLRHQPKVKGGPLKKDQR